MPLPITQTLEELNGNVTAMIAELKLLNYNIQAFQSSDLGTDLRIILGDLVKLLRLFFPEK